MYEVMIIGGGPAGLSACVYTAWKRLKTIIISSDIGGQMNWTLNIENYLGYQFITAEELIAKFQEQVRQFPVEQVIGYKITRLDKIDGGFEAELESGDKYQAQTVIVATGKKPRRLDVAGEVEFTGKGVSYCAICDGPLFAGQKVAIVGGGNSAVQTALDMVKIAEHVNIISATHFTADPILLDKLLAAKNLSVFIDHTIDRITGQGFVSGIEIKDMHTGEIKTFDVSGVFIEVGLMPNSDLVEKMIELNERQEVPVTCSGRTGVPGLYAAGDVTDIPEKQILVAAGEGAKAALQAHHFLQRQVKQ